MDWGFLRDRNFQIALGVGAVIGFFVLMKKGGSLGALGGGVSEGASATYTPSTFTDSVSGYNNLQTSLDNQIATLSGQIDTRLGQYDTAQQNVLDKLAAISDGSNPAVNYAPMPGEVPTPLGPPQSVYRPPVIVPTPTPPPAVSTPTPTPSPSPLTPNAVISVKKGENWATIANKYNLSLDQLRQLNPEFKGKLSSLGIGQQVKIHV